MVSRALAAVITGPVGFFIGGAIDVLRLLPVALRYWLRSTMPSR